MTSDLAENIAKIVGTIIAVATTFVAIVRGWYHSRFVSVHKRIDMAERSLQAQKDLIRLHGDKLHEHDNQLGQIGVHIDTIKEMNKETKDGIKTLNIKLDKVVGR